MLTKWTKCVVKRERVSGPTYVCCFHSFYSGVVVSSKGFLNWSSHGMITGQKPPPAESEQRRTGTTQLALRDTRAGRGTQTHTSVHTCMPSVSKEPY